MAVAYTGFQAVDVHWGDATRPGLVVWVIDHRYHETRCACGHVTRAVAGQGRVDPLLAGIEPNEWRLVGPWLAAVIVALAYRFRLSRARIQEFLAKWLDLGRSAHPARAATRHIARRLRAAPKATLIRKLMPWRSSCSTTGRSSSSCWRIPNSR